MVVIHHSIYLNFGWLWRLESVTRFGRFYTILGMLVHCKQSHLFHLFVGVFIVFDWMGKGMPVQWISHSAKKHESNTPIWWKILNFKLISIQHEWCSTREISMIFCKHQTSFREKKIIESVETHSIPFIFCLAFRRECLHQMNQIGKMKWSLSKQSKL